MTIKGESWKAGRDENGDSLLVSPDNYSDELVASDAFRERTDQIKIAVKLEGL